jgi:hypothetical protein
MAMKYVYTWTNGHGLSKFVRIEITLRGEGRR